MSSTIFTAQKAIDGSVSGVGGGGVRKRGGENSPISPPLDPRLGTSAAKQTRAETMWICSCRVSPVYTTIFLARYLFEFGPGA